MKRLIWIKAILTTITFFLWIQVGGPGAEAAGGSYRDDGDGDPAVLRILDRMPQGSAGGAIGSGVPDDATFGVLVESRYGINLSDSASIRFEIDDGVHFPYQRDLSSDTMRVVRVEDEDPRKDLIWVVYDRSLETRLPPLYFPDKIVQITVNLEDLYQNRLSPREFRFKIESDFGYPTDFDRLPDYDFMDRDLLISETSYDSGMEILSGELEGAKIIYNSKEPLTPGFGPIDDIEALNLEDSQGAGAPLNLIPHTIFHTPVKLMIPFPEGTDIAGMDIFYHNGEEWLRACDADGNVLPGGRGWMVPGTRVNHFMTTPLLVEIQVYHFSAAQGGFVVVTTGTDRDQDHSDQSGTVVVAKCFIETTIDDTKPGFGLHTFLWVLGILGLLSLTVLWFRHFSGLLPATRRLKR
jgi:hypothetical protein